MEPIGFRRLDRLGRIVVPFRIREKLDMHVNDGIEIYVSIEGIVLRKYRPACIFCGETEKVVSIHDKLICKHCLSDLKTI